MGGKSRKTGSVSKALIDRLTREKKAGTAAGKPNTTPQNKEMANGLGISTAAPKA